MTFPAPPLTRTRVRMEGEMDPSTCAPLPGLTVAPPTGRAVSVSGAQSNNGLEARTDQENATVGLPGVLCPLGEWAPGTLACSRQIPRLGLGGTSWCLPSQDSASWHLLHPPLTPSSVPTPFTPPAPSPAPLLGSHVAGPSLPPGSSQAKSRPLAPTVAAKGLLRAWECQVQPPLPLECVCNAIC